MQVQRLPLISQAGRKPGGSGSGQYFGLEDGGEAISTSIGRPRLERRDAAPRHGAEPAGHLRGSRVPSFTAWIQTKNGRCPTPGQGGGHRPFVSCGGTRGAPGSLSSVRYLTGTAGDSSAGRRLSKIVAPISCSAWLLIERSIPLRSRSKDTAVSEIRVMHKR